MDAGRPCRRVLALKLGPGGLLGVAARARAPPSPSSHPSPRPTTSQHLLQRSSRGLDPAWALKPAGASRSVGLTATRRADVAAAHRASRDGDRVAQLAVLAPATLGGHKFDLRVILLVKSFSPPVAALYRGGHARVARAPADASGAGLVFPAAFGTVGCYDEGGGAGEAAGGGGLGWADADSGGVGRAGADSGRPGTSVAGTMLPRAEVDIALAAQGWDPGETFARVADVARGVVRAGGTVIGPWPRCAAAYGLDVILDAAAGPCGPTPAPRLLEVNFAPDVAAAARFRPGLQGEVLAELFGGGPCGAGSPEFMPLF